MSKETCCKEASKYERNNARILNAIMLTFNEERTKTGQKERKKPDSNKARKQSTRMPGRMDIRNKQAESAR